MEPRPQKPRPQTPPTGATQPVSQPGTPAAPQPTQQIPYQPGHDPAAFVAPSRMEYDYSPLDLQPPGQRRKRQIIAGIIGALVVVAISALIVAGWMALRDDDKGGNNTNDDNRVAELTASPTAPPTDESQVSTPGAESTTPPETEVTPTVPPTAVPTFPVFDATTIRSALPVVESMPGPFVEAGDTPSTFADVVDALGGDPSIETTLTDLGWQASMQRSYTSSEPETTGTTIITVSVHAFKDEVSAQSALDLYATILGSIGWTPVDWDQYGGGSRLLTWTDPTSGEESVSIYVVDGNLLYRVRATGPAGFDSTENAIWVVNQIVQN
ncbi:MAG: hypothetical protein M9953_03240 [Thermomicrobiales bacterium]|nr:hypothetical protein [Thermomicrobiales bacterium]MCO5218655.1 hypothetical protein [Thermomicrobiales bacterium]MCO5224332.1 hypothetical protein [Thermomicrobiales bacterium]MCO5229070.1 hypothetical protein [Thermomicrobiales bacterium]